MFFIPRLFRSRLETVALKNVGQLVASGIVECMYVCMYVCMYIYIYACIYIYIYIYMHA